ncbi:MAG TPA: Flp pilus assembly protein CpaB [Candidatus Limnocylindrales bacterium]|jgi:Flp pilus assembly protein CpaB|nr:Flp pilus assembly protein CpaB [Candidatus Limnocylindrales bacterium]
MELEFQDDRRRGRIVMGLGLVLAIIAGGAAYYAVNQAQQQVGQGSLQRVPVVVATTLIPAREAIKEDQVAVRQVPIDDTNLNGVATEVSQVVGRIPAVSILQGQLVTSNMLASSAENSQFSILGPGESISPDSEYWRAVSITVPDDLAVGGLLDAGQTVDVFVTTVVTVPPDVVAGGDFYSDRSTKITYQNMVILARRESFYVLRANLAVAEEIVHLQASGTAMFSLALRPAIDQRFADARGLGETTNRIIATYGIPIPKPIDGSGAIGGGRPNPTPTPVPTPSPAP